MSLPSPQRHTINQIANRLGLSEKAVRRMLAGVHSGVANVGGKQVAAYTIQQLPLKLREEIDALRTRDGEPDLEAWMLRGKPAFTPRRRHTGEPVPLVEVRADEMERAQQLRDALRPALEYHEAGYSLADCERRALESFQGIFGKSFSPRHVRELIARTLRRVRSRADWDMVQNYLPDHPALATDGPAELQPGEFADVRIAIQELNRSAPAAAEVRAMWRLVFQHLESASDAKPVANRLRDLLWQEGQFLFASRDALRKQFEYQRGKFQSDPEGGLRDRRAEANARRADESKCELTRQIEALNWFIPAARFFYLHTNRTENSGSMPEAIRRTISLPAVPVGWSKAVRTRFLKVLQREELPACPAALRELILERQRRGAVLVPSAIAREICVSPAVVKQHRNPTEAALNYLSAPGSLFFITDPQTGERRPPRIGEVIEADDATINFPVCVPWTLGGDPCSEKYGVKVGRFQWLVAVDAASRYVTAWTYVMRPRSSYRAEDALALMRAHCLQHGIPAQWRFEQGVWKSNLVQHAVAGIGSVLQTVWSPHQKPYIEGLFNTLWTKLSVHFPGSDVGRFRGETEAANELLTACQRGQRDPRRHFPMLSTALAAFTEVIAEKNQTPVESAIGRWLPADRWSRKENQQTLSAGQEWAFSPFVREWTVKGMLVGGKVPLFEDLRVPFDFAADWLPQYHGAKVRVHFDPMSPRCQGLAVLAQSFNGKAEGHELGIVTQINEVASHARMALGLSDDPESLGRLARERNAAALRRETRAVSGGPSAYQHSEERDGVAQITRLERAKPRNTQPTETEQSEDALIEMMARNAEGRTNRLREIEGLEQQNKHLFQ